MPETYAPFHDFHLIDSNEQTAPEDTEVSRAQLALWFTLSGLLEAVKAIVGSVLFIERQASSLHLKTDTTPLSQLSVDLPVFPYWPQIKGMTKADFDKVLADEKPTLDAARLALHRLSLETNSRSVSTKPRITAEQLRARLDQESATFRAVQARTRDNPLVSTRNADKSSVTVANDPVFRDMADSMGRLLTTLPPHWRLGIDAKSLALADPGQRWVAAILDLAFAGVIELATWRSEDHIEVLEDSAAASVLAIKAIVGNSHRPNKGKGTYSGQREMVKADADEAFAKLASEARPDLAALQLCVTIAVSHAGRIVMMSRQATAVSPSAFVGSFVWLDEALERLSAVENLSSLLCQWPEELRGFTWGRRTRSSALERGIMFAKSIHTASVIARSIHRMPLDDGYWDQQLVGSVPGDGIIRWTELTMQELREKTIPLSYVWPSSGDIDEDLGRIIYAIEGEYRQAVAGLTSLGGSAVETPDQEALRILYEVGRHMESLPDFRGQGEEALRAVFVCALGASSFRVTAESLNGKGKTDILVARNGANVLIGECKFWSGAKGYFETIDQLAGYLIYRDARATILLFVQAKDMAAVVRQVEQKTRDHPLWMGTYGQVKEGWYDFEVRTAPGSEHTARVSVLCFHLPTNG